METIDEKITGFISKLQRLKELAKQYQEKWPYGEVDYRGLNTGADNYWSQNVQPLVEEIDLDLEDIWDYLTAYTKRGDNFGGYLPPFGTVEQNLRRDINHVINQSRNSEKINALIQHLKKVQRRHHVKAETSGKAGNEPNKADENKTYIKKGDAWEISFNGETKIFVPHKGIKIIAFLIEHKHEEFEPLKVEQAIQDKEEVNISVEGIGDLSLTTNGSTAKKYKILDKIATAEVRKTIIHIEDKIASNESEAEKRKLEEKLKFLKDYLNQSKTPAGGNKTFEDESDNARKRVTGAVKTAYEVIAKEHPALYKHLQKNLQAKSICYYKPIPEIIWRIS